MQCVSVLLECIGDGNAAFDCGRHTVASQCFAALGVSMCEFKLLPQTLRRVDVFVVIVYIQNVRMCVEQCSYINMIADMFKTNLYIDFKLTLILSLVFLLLFKMTALY